MCSPFKEMSYAKITIIEIPAKENQKIKIECKPTAIHLLEQAINNSYTEVLRVESSIPEKYHDLLAKINRNTLESGIYSFDIRPAEPSSVALFKIEIAPVTFTKTFHSAPSDINKYITDYLQVLNEVLPNYITNCVEALRSNQYRRVDNVEHQLDRYVQLTSAVNTKFSIGLCGFMEICVNFFGMNIDTALIMNAMKEKTHMDTIIDTLRRSQTIGPQATLGFDITTNSLTKRIMSPDVVRLRLNKRSVRSNVTIINLDDIFGDNSSNVTPIKKVAPIVNEVVEEEMND